MWVYQCLDILNTVLEMVCLYIISRILLKEPRFHTPLCKYIPPIILFMVTWIFTWFSGLGAFKIPIIAVLTVIVLKVSYKESVFQSIIVVEMWLICCVFLTEVSIYLISKFIFNNTIFVTIDGQSMLRWEMYVIAIANLVVPPGAWGDWINGGGWLVINGYHVDLILRDIKRVEQIMKDTEHGIVTANYQTGHPHGYISAMYRGELAISKILYAKNESLCELKKQAETYPNALQKSLVNFFMFEAGFSLMFVKANSGTDDKYYIAGHVFRIVSCLNQVLFACNNAYCINEKKAIKLLETFEHKPEKYTEKVNHIFEVLGISLFECYDMTEKLYNEVNEIVSEINNFLNEESSDERKQI